MTHKTVPRSPTDEMIDAGDMAAVRCRVGHINTAVWQAMYDAAPVQPTLAAPPEFSSSLSTREKHAYECGAAAMREAAAKACLNEQVDEVATGDREDHSYNMACEHCYDAISAIPLEPPK
jgi:hypothetical protein